MGYRFPHEKLDVWRLAKVMAKTIYELTAQFPRSECYGLTDQLRRAGVSVMSNLAEGSARTSRRDQGHFYQLAYSSLMEVDAQLQLAVDLGFLTPERYDELRLPASELANKVNALRQTCLKEKL